MSDTSDIEFQFEEYTDELRFIKIKINAIWEWSNAIWQDMRVEHPMGRWGAEPPKMLAYDVDNLYILSVHFRR